METYRLSDLEEYDEGKFLVKPVYSGKGSEAKLLHLLPGQRVPIHPHPQREVILLPRKGAGVLLREGAEDVPLVCGTLYHFPPDSSFGLRNDGAAPFQTLVTLVRAGGGAA